MDTILSTLIDFMDEGKWHYEIIEGESLLRFHFKGKSVRLLCYADVEEDKRWLVFYSYLPVYTPAEKMSDMAEFIARANRGMRIGNFELDFDDGEIRFKTSLDIEGGELTNKMIDNLLQANLCTMDRYFSGMMELIYGQNTPKDLIQKVEGLDDQADEDDDDDEDEEGDELGSAEYLPDDEDEDESNRRRFS